MTYRLDQRRKTALIGPAALVHSVSQSCESRTLNKLATSPHPPPFLVFYYWIHMSRSQHDPTPFCTTDNYHLRHAISIFPRLLFLFCDIYLPRRGILQPSHQLHSTLHFCYMLLKSASSKTGRIQRQRAQCRSVVCCPYDLALCRNKLNALSLT